MTLFNDVFSDDAFGFINLTEAVQKLPFVEGRLGQMGLFNFVEGIETDMVGIDETEGQLHIMTSRQRGAPPGTPPKDKLAKMRAIKVPHYQEEDRVMASSLFGKRKPGQNVLQSVAQKVNDRYTWMLNNMIAPTLETHRLNALMGVLKDGDGSTIYDYFDFFDVTQDTKDFAFSVGTTNIRAKCVEVRRLVEDNLGGVPFNSIHAICGRTWFDKLVDHPMVRDTYVYQSGQTLREDLGKNGRIFTFGDITFEEYRGMRGLTGSIGQVNDSQAIFFPTGVSSMFRTYYAPAGFLETVGELGQPMYAKIAPDLKYNEHVDQLIETNPLFINTRPKAVILGTLS